MKIILILLGTLLFTINSQETKLNDVQPLEIFNLTEISYKDEEIKLDEDLQKDYDEIISIHNRSRIAACMLILRTSLSKGNLLVIQTLKESKHDKEKTYDKIIGQMLDTCYKEMPEQIVEKVLNYDNVGLWEDSFEKYLEFNKSLFQIIGPDPKLSTSEKSIINEISKVVQNPGIEIKVVEEKVDFFTEKLGKYKYMAFGMIIGFSISLLVVIIINSSLKK